MNGVGEEMLNIFDVGISSDNNILVGGVYKWFNRKINWTDVSLNVQLNKNTVDKILPYSFLGSPLVIVPLISFLSYGTSSSMIERLGGANIFWILTVIFGLIIAESVVMLILRSFNIYKPLSPAPPLIVQKNIITNDINARFRHNQASGGILSVIFSKVPYLQLFILMPILGLFVWGAYEASNDKDGSFISQILFYIILLILIASIIGYLQLAIPAIVCLVKIEKLMSEDIKKLDVHLLQVELNKAEDFYERHKVSHAAIKRYLAEYKKILEEKEKEMQK